jgi:hypothetical protein
MILVIQNAVKNLLHMISMRDTVMMNKILRSALDDKRGKSLYKTASFLKQKIPAIILLTCRDFIIFIGILLILNSFLKLW